MLAFLTFLATDVYWQADNQPDQRLVADKLPEISSIFRFVSSLVNLQWAGQLLAGIADGDPNTTSAKINASQASLDRQRIPFQTVGHGCGASSRGIGWRRDSLIK